TPVYKAAFHGRPSLIELLSKAGMNERLIVINMKDKSGQAPIHVAAHWKLVDILRMLLKAKSDVNIADHMGRTPLYICVSSLSTKLYFEDLRHQFMCIVTLFSADSDMLNLIEWLQIKGPGIPQCLLRDAGPDFQRWYAMQISRPPTLKNMCRKVIQMRVGRRGNLIKMCDKLPLPPSLRLYLKRKQFYHEDRTHYMRYSSTDSS
ncbi:hypothetical protein CAPTEDRAFT_93586, partial [Capitella teleta]